MADVDRPLLGAVLIAKDESRVIRKTLDSISSHVDSIAIVVDAASTDDTLSIVKSYPKARAWSVPFSDYANARNRALDLARQEQPTEFTISLSADETLAGGEKLRAFLDGHRKASDNAYCVMMRSGNRQWPFPRILRTGGGWKYFNTAGRRHEQPGGPNGEIEGPIVLDVFVLHEESDPERKNRRLREHDLPDLTAVVEDETQPLEARAEAMFQLAETHFVIGHTEPLGEDKKPERGGRWLSHKFQAMAFYTRYAEIAEVPGSKVYNLQKAMYARLQFCNVADTFGLFEPSELVKRLVLVAANAPQLPEAHWLLAKNAAYVDVRKAIPLALIAAKVARAVYDRPVHGPVDITLEWQALRLAAECAKAIKDKRLMQSFAKQALEAGAPREMIGDMVGPS